MTIAAPSVGTLLKDHVGITHPLAAPADVSDGRILIKVGALESQAELLTDDDGDWTEMLNTFTETGGDRSVAAWRKLAASESGDYAFGHPTSDQGWGVVLSYPGVDQATPEDQAATLVHHLDESDPIPASIITQTLNAWVVIICWKTGGASAPLTGPAGMTPRVSDNTGNKVMRIVDEGPLAIQTYNPNNFAGAGTVGDSSIITLALKPELLVPIVIPVPTGPER